MADTGEGSDTVEIFETLGMSGLSQSRGIIREEFLPQLKGRRGRKVYREMADNDPTVGAILYLLDVLIQQVGWHIQPSSVDDPRAEEAAEFVAYEQTHMRTKWADVISDANSAFAFGWSFLETTYRRRADGWIGWYKMEGRAQETLYSWDFDEETGEVRGFYQRVFGTTETKYVPIAKGLHFRTRIVKGSPEGRALLRNAYRPWFFLKHIQEVEAVGIERDLAGFPVMQVPKKILMAGASSAEKALASDLLTMISQVKRDEREGLLIPSEDDGFKFSLMASAGKRQFDTSVVIRRYQVDILMSVLAELLMLGMDKHGSFSLASSKTGLLAMAIKAYLVRMRDVFNGALQQLMELNPKFPKDVWPTFEFGDVELPDIQALAEAIAKLVGAGVVIPDRELEKRLRIMLGLPPPPEEGPDLEDEKDKRDPAPKQKPGDADPNDPEDPAGEET